MKSFVFLVVNLIFFLQIIKCQVYNIDLNFSSFFDDNTVACNRLSSFLLNSCADTNTDQIYLSLCDEQQLANAITTFTEDAV